jgi:hypothetical protein
VVRFVKEKMVVFGEKQKDSCCFSGEGVSRFTQIDKTILPALQTAGKLR